MIQEMVRDFANAEVAPLAHEIDENHRFPTETWDKMVEHWPRWTSAWLQWNLGDAWSGVRSAALQRKPVGGAWRTVRKSQVKKLKELLKEVDEVFLATDEDREGEAIAWHTAEILKKKGRNFHRVLFHELTRNAIREAIAHPEELQSTKYEAQQARRILDRLVGYQVSPLLWRKVKGGLSAGPFVVLRNRLVLEPRRIR